MEPISTNLDLGNTDRTDISSSSSIDNSISSSNLQGTNIDTIPYQTNHQYNSVPIEEVDLSEDINIDVSGSTLSETVSSLASGVAEFGSKIGAFLFGGIDIKLATGAVFQTTLLSGVLDIGEGIVDGLAWCGGKIVEGGSWLLGKAIGNFNEDIGEAVINAGKERDNAVKEFMEVDWIGRANDWFYQETDIGRKINEASLLKYDSKAAQKIRSFTERAAEIAAATALTIFTGGAAAPLAVGLLYGMGKAGESTYHQHGTDTSLLQELGIAGSGVLTGLSWIPLGKLGQGFINIGRTAANVGVKEVASNIVKDIATKDFWMNALKKGLTGANGVGNYFASAIMTGEDVIPYITGEQELDKQALGHIALSYLKHLGFNVAEDALREYVLDLWTNKVFDDISFDTQEVVKTVGNKAAETIDPSKKLARPDYLNTVHSREKIPLTHEEIAQIAKRFNITEAQARILIDKKIIDIVDNSEVGIRVKMSTLEKALDGDGKLKNQFETGTSGGAFDPDWRSDVEYSLFGVPKDLPAEDRPIYGMMFPNTQKGLAKYIMYGEGSFYGGGEGMVVILDKSKIIDTATYTIGDSLDYEKSISAGLLSDPKFLSTHGNFTVLGGIYNPEDLKKLGLLDLFTTSRGDRYLEVQLHGRESHSIENIKEVIFTMKMIPPQEFLDKLTAKGIPYRILTELR